MDGPFLTPPGAPNHRLWWILLGGVVGTAVILAMLAMIYLQNQQSTPPPDGWQHYFETRFHALEERLGSEHLGAWRSDVRAQLDRIETELRTAPHRPMEGCLDPQNPYECATPVPTPTSLEPETGS